MSIDTSYRLAVKVMSSLAWY